MAMGRSERIPRVWVVGGQMGWVWVGSGSLGGLWTDPMGMGMCLGRLRKLGRRWRWVNLGTDPRGLGGLWTDPMGLGRLGETRLANRKICIRTGGEGGNTISIAANIDRSICKLPQRRNLQRRGESRTCRLRRNLSFRT